MKTMKMIGTFVMVSLLFMVACDKDTDPADRDLFVGNVRRHDIIQW